MMKRFRTSDGLPARYCNILIRVLQRKRKSNERAVYPLQAIRLSRYKRWDIALLVALL